MGDCRIGVDWGGTKIELLALDPDGREMWRKRIATPREYDSCVAAVVALVKDAENALSCACTVGFGIPGTISPATGLVKNANSVWLNGRPLKNDLERLLQRKVKIENDANCLAVSESVDGAGAGHRIVAGVIIGTGCGSGLAIDGKVHPGRHGIAGEFGHTPLPWMTPDEYPGQRCWCGKNGCLETWISGTGFSADYQRRTGELEMRSGDEIIAIDSKESRQSYNAYCDRLARGLSVLVNICDPDVIVLGGGMSLVSSIYQDVPWLMEKWVFSDVFDTPVYPAKHGDSSGVRGAAWLWS